MTDGAGSGSWFTVRIVGEVIDCYDLTEPAGFLFADGQTIGNASSNATARANADTQTLFNKLWTIGDTHGTLAIYDSAGAASTFGADAATDWAANKAIALPDHTERVSVGWSASNVRIPVGTLDCTTPGTGGGVGGYTLAEANIPLHTHSFSGAAYSTYDGIHSHTGYTTSSGNHTHTYTRYSTTVVKPNGGGTSVLSGGTTLNTGAGGNHSHTVYTYNSSSHRHYTTISGTTGSYGTGATDVPLVQPTIVCTKLIFFGVV